MIKLMIVDDESSIRRGLKHYIDWSAWDIVLAAEASDGAEAFQRALEVRPDILITDIRMPEKDGLELCRLLREALPYLRIILLTGYDSKEYLYGALQNGVHDYLLKPASADKIISCVLKCKEEILAEQNQRNRKMTMDAFMDESIPILQMTLINDLLKGNVRQAQGLIQQSKLLKVPLDGPWYQTMTMHIRKQSEDDCCSQVEQDMAHWQLIQKIEGVCRRDEAFFCELTPGEYFILINGNCRDEAMRRTEKTAEGLVVGIGHNDGRHVMIGIGTLVSALGELGKSYDAACRAFQESAWNRSLQIFPAETKFAEVLSQAGTAALRRSFSALAAGRSCVSDIEELFCICRKEHTDIRELRKSISHLISLAKQMKDLGGADELRRFEEYQLEDFLYADELETWVLEYFRAYEEREEQPDAHSQLVDKAIAYVKSHYPEEITLQNLSKKLFISPNYLGRIFREEMGCKFSDWLNHYRIDRAKELIRTTDQKSQEIGEAVGFSNYKYFSVCFAKYAGCSLRDYKNQYGAAREC